MLLNIQKNLETLYYALDIHIETFDVDRRKSRNFYPSGCERQFRQFRRFFAAAAFDDSTIRSKRQDFSRAAESRSRHPDRCSPLGPARGHVAHNAHSGPVGRRAEGEASAAALRLSSSQSQAPAR